jgi:uncharacterized coiled-coil protein SlyX
MLDRVTRLVLVLVCSALGCAKSEDRITTLESRIAELERKVGEQDESLQHLGKLPSEQKSLSAKVTALEAADVLTSDRLAVLLTGLGDVNKQLAGVQVKTGVVVEAEFSGAFVKSGVKACDDYLEKYTKCITDKVPAAARKQMLEALAMSAQAWKEAAEGPAREGLETACKAAFDAAKQATEAMGCEF